METPAKSSRVILTRCRYCQHCFNRGIPEIKTKFVVYGSKNVYKTVFVENYGIRGFSPHIYLLDKVVGEVVSFYYSCSICNSQRTDYNKMNFYIIPDKTFQKDTMLLKDWNALVLHPDLGYKI